MSETPKQSDQLPEEGPPGQVPDDVPGAGEGAAREASERQAEREGQDQDDIGYRDDAEENAYRRGERG